MSKPILFLWDVAPKLRDYISRSLTDSQVDLLFPESGGDPKDYALKHASSAQAIVGWRPSEDLLEKADKLQLYINPGAGVQHLIKPFKEIQQKRDVVLVNGHGNAFFTAEHIVAMLLGAANQLFPHHHYMQAGRWRTGDGEVKSISLRSRKIGLLGYGHVNREVHRLLNPFGAEFHIMRRQSSRTSSESLTVKAYYGPDELDRFLEMINVLIVTLPLTEETDGLIRSRELKLLGPDSFLINTGRGPVVEEQALYEALKSGTIAAAAIDVWYNYRPDADEKDRKYPYAFPFHELDNILLSPHRAASPFDDLERWDDVIENIRRLAEGRTDYLNVVDVEAGY